MIHFIIGEDNKEIHKNINNVVDKVMVGGNLAYTKRCFFDYDKSFLAVIDEKLSNKIYILDIETPTNTGIEMARKIRKDDIHSIIIFLTAYKEKYQDTILSSEFMFFAFISKVDDYEAILFEKITHALAYASRRNAIRFKDQNFLYTIPMEDIIYITTDTQSRKTIIITDHTSFHVNKPLHEIESLLEKHFIKTHRACIINKNRVISIDMKNRLIYFDNKSSIDLLSRDYKKKLQEVLRMDLIRSN